MISCEYTSYLATKNCELVSPHIGKGSYSMYHLILAKGAIHSLCNLILQCITSYWQRGVFNVSPHIGKGSYSMCHLILAKGAIQCVTSYCNASPHIGKGGYSMYHLILAKGAIQCITSYWQRGLYIQCVTSYWQRELFNVSPHIGKGGYSMRLASLYHIVN